MKDVLRSISLHLHDSDVKTREQLLGKIIRRLIYNLHKMIVLSSSDSLRILSQNYPEEFKEIFSRSSELSPCQKSIDELMASIEIMKI